MKKFNTHRADHIDCVCESLYEELEIVESEYQGKMRWMRDSSHSVRLHSDLDTQGKTWCRRNLQRHQWKMNTWTNVYEHTFYFELKEHALEFEKQFPKFTNQ